MVGVMMLMMMRGVERINLGDVNVREKRGVDDAVVIEIVLVQSEVTM